jgi:hypothetical protein
MRCQLDMAMFSHAFDLAKFLVHVEPVEEFLDAGSHASHAKLPSLVLVSK